MCEPSVETDADLLRTYVGQGDIDAFDQLVDRHQEGLLLLASSFLRDGHSFQDVVQEAFIKLANRAGELIAGAMPGDSVRPWLRQVVRNAAIDRIRHEKRTVMSGEATLEERGAEEAADDDSDLAALLWRCVDGLSPLQQAAVVMRFRDGRSYQEIAEELGKTVNHIGVLLNRALGRLRDNNDLRSEVLP